MLLEIKDRELKILGHEYQLRRKYRSLVECDSVAQVCFYTANIEIEDAYPQARQEEGLLHEIIEIINFHLALKLDHDKMTALSEGLYQVFKDNF